MLLLTHLRLKKEKKSTLKSEGKGKWSAHKIHTSLWVENIQLILGQDSPQKNCQQYSSCEANPWLCGLSWYGRSFLSLACPMPLTYRGLELALVALYENNRALLVPVLPGSPHRAPAWVGLSIPCTLGITVRNTVIYSSQMTLNPYAEHLRSWLVLEGAR